MKKKKEKRKKRKRRPGIEGIKGGITRERRKPTPTEDMIGAFAVAQTRPFTAQDASKLTGTHLSLVYMILRILEAKDLVEYIGKDNQRRGQWRVAWED